MLDSLSIVREQVREFNQNPAVGAVKTEDNDPYKQTVWKPLPGPQTNAINCQADELLYGGAAGSAKSDLLLGIAGLNHRRSIIFRRVFPELRGLIDRSREIYNYQGQTSLKDSFNEGTHIWKLHDGKIIEFGALQYEKDKENYRGRPHDFYGWDEVTEFTESQYRFVNAWNRTTIRGQRCRVIATANPPNTVEGRWIIDYWGPWLNDKHPNPAVPGELRWFVSIEGEDVEVENGTPFSRNGETLIPRSRSFIPGRLSDNPYLSRTGYEAVLQGLPEPLRSQMLYGDFKAGMADDQWQVIPTAWVDAAIERGRQTPKPFDEPLAALGVDCARGGKAQFLISKRYGNWFAPLIKHKGISVPDGPTGAKVTLDCHEDGAAINVDVIGIGSSVYDSLKDVEGVPVNAINNAAGTKTRDRTGKYRLVNVRAASYWKFREMLDPVHGDNICLPDDAEMRADLCIARYKVTTQGIIVEPKEEIMKRLGRSPDCFVAGTLITTSRGQIPIEKIKSGDLVYTRKGFQPVIISGQTYREFDTYVVQFKDGKELTGTGNHPVWIQGKGFVPIKSICVRDNAWALENPTSLSFLRDWNLGDMKDGNISALTRETEGIMSKESNPYTRKFGNFITAPYLREKKYITKTAIPSTITSLTWKHLREANTCGQTGEAVGQQILNTLKEFNLLPKSGTEARKGELSILRLLRQRTKLDLGKSEFVSYVNKNSNAKAEVLPGRGLDSAPIPVYKDGTITMLPMNNVSAHSVVRNSEGRYVSGSEEGNLSQLVLSPVQRVYEKKIKEPVFNLMVANSHEFFANGILVHNCGDSVVMASWMGEWSAIELPTVPFFTVDSENQWKLG